ncbi:MAG: IS1634 family transposase [Prolixibacteraceae bacterium]|jgi:transposase|nr:IS1634 family transposase [Candidatus Magasanikbacteria bacterium]MBT7397239.1 IS1634 family transposase [Prolixibacteraceae bacterium]
MYIRRTTTKSRKDGSQYFTYRLVESYRTEKGVRQKTLLNLGVDFSLTKNNWPILTKRIEEILSGQLSLFAIDGDIEKLAQNYASIIIASRRDTFTQTESDYQEVDVDSLEMSRPRSVGGEHITLETLRFLGLDKKFEELGFNKVQTSAAIGTIIGRACEPGSELATHQWLQERSGLGELIDYDFNKLSLYGFYKISDQLLKNKNAIETYLYAKERSVFTLQETITLYDLTNTYFEGVSKGNNLTAYGHSKEKRTDCPLVTLGLVLDSSGFPRRSHVYEGNVTESKTLSKMIKGLEKGGEYSNLNPTVVMDAGIATDENIIWLKKNKYPYLVVSRKRHREFNKAASVIVKEDDECTVRVQKVLDEDKKEMLLYCHSTMREKKDQAINGRFSTRFEEELQKLSNGLHKKGCLKKYNKVMEKIGRLRQKFPRVSKLYDISVDKGKINAVKITWEKNLTPNTTDTYPGVYCLRTSQTNWDESKVWKTYIMLTELEAVFRSLKSELGLRPVHHQITDRISGHLFITVLAYHLVHAIRYRLKLAGIFSNWSSLRKFMLTQNRVTVSMNCKNNSILHIRKSNRPEPKQQEIYTALGQESIPGSTSKTIIQAK